MSKRHKYIVFGIVLSAITAAFVLLNHDEEEPSPSPVATKKSRPQPIDEKHVQETAETLEPLPQSEENVRKLVNMYGLSEVQSDHYLKGMRGLENKAKAANIEIKFNGRVIDQNGEPVEGARVSVSVNARREDVVTQILNIGSENTKLSETETREVYSDGQGAFSVTDLSGVSVVVQEIEKDGYLYQAKRHFYFDNFSPESLKQATDEQPATFVLWKKGDAQALIKTKFRMVLGPGEHNTAKTVHLVDLPKNPGYVDQGDFRVTVYNEGQGRGERNRPLRLEYDWWVNIEAVNGGILSTNDFWLYAAPSGGYQKSLRIGKKSGAPDWRSETEQDMRVYFKSHNNFGSAIIKIVADAQGGLGVIMKDILINPNGSRNLEYDRKKEIELTFYYE